MPIPNIDTFEHDISEEIKTKEATMGDIASASGEIGNTPVQSSSTSTLLIALGLLLLAAVVAVSVIFFIKYSKGSAIAPSANGNTQQPSGIQMSFVSDSIDQAIGGSLGTIQKSGYGYTIDILSYSDVFAYMIKNEQKYADELADSVGSPRDSSSTTTPPFFFTDVTINNQNMRVGTSASSTVVYAFVNTKTLLFSSSTEGVLALRSAILHR